MLHGSTWVLNCDIAPVPLCPISQTSLLCHQDLLSVLGRQLEKDEWGRREEGGGRREEGGRMVNEGGKIGGR